MAFGQMYYTSCRRGLSGAPGFQFHAVSPGLGPDVLRDAEALTSYQPPRALTLTPSAENIRRAPVNLCFRPGPVALLSNVVYVGTDYSRRPGNYFAHTLVSRDPGADLGPVLPIELWRAPFWVCEEIDGTELPELAGPPPAGAIDRADVAAFLRGHPGVRHLPALLTAADETVRTHRRKVVIVGADSDEVARWIATLSYLLPPPTAARMSFATYDGDPRYSRMDVIGSTGDAGLDLGADELTAYHLFDFAADRVSDVAVHPLARILAELEPAVSDAAWSRVTRMAAGDEQSLDDWLPVVAAALMTWPSGPESARDEPAAVAAWLARHGERLDPDTVRQVGRAVLALLASETGEDCLRALRDLGVAATGCGSAELLEAAEVRTVDVFAATVRADGLTGAPELSLTSARARTRAEQWLAADLPGLPATVIATLAGWAGSAGLSLDEEALDRAGERIVGPAVLHAPGDVPLRDALARNAPLRAGVARYLEAVGPDELDRIVTALEQGLAELLGPQMSSAGPWTRRAAVVAEVRSGRLEPVDGLAAVHDAAEAPDEALLALLFGDRPWTLDQARRILALLGKAGTEAPAVARRIEDTVLADGDEEGVEAYARFCLGLRPTGLYPRLGGPARTRIDLMAELSAWIDRLAEARKEQSGPLAEFRKWTAKHDAAEQRLIEAVLAARFDDFYASVRARLLVDLPGVRHSYCAGLSKSLSRRTIDFEIAATALLTLAAVARMNPAPPVRAAVAELDAVLRRSVGRWNGRTQQRLLEVLALDARPGSVTWIDRWMRQQPPGILGRVRGLFGAGRGADESAGAGRRGL